MGTELAALLELLIAELLKVLLLDMALLEIALLLDFELLNVELELLLAFELLETLLDDVVGTTLFVTEEAAMLLSELELAGKTEEATEEDFAELDDGMVVSGVWLLVETLLAARLLEVVGWEEAFTEDSAADDAPLPVGGVTLLPPQAVNRVVRDTTEIIRSE